MVALGDSPLPDPGVAARWVGAPLRRDAVLVVIAAVGLLFTGRYSQDIYRLALGINQWSMRVTAYTSLMTDQYPPFRIGE